MADWIDLMIGRLEKLHPGAGFDSYHVTGRISRIAARLAQREEEIFGRSDLSRGDVGVLAALRVMGPPHRLSPTQLFRGLMLSSAGMTSRVDRLEARGLVRRLRDPNDRRGVLVELTAEGRRLVDRVLQENTRSESELLAGLSGAERARLATTLKKLLTTLESPAGE
jgi:DNA-binding MarR family transcriptional regulator